MIQLIIRLRLLVLLFGLGFAFSVDVAPALSADQTAIWIGSGNWSNPANWSTALFPNNGNGGFTFDAILNGGSIAVDQDITIEGFALNVGYVFGPEDLTIGTIDWRAGGFISNTGSAQPGITTILGGVIQGTATHYLERTARIAGAVDWKAGNFTQFQIPNSGLLQVASGGTLTVSGTADRDYSVPITVDSGGTLHATSTGQTGSSALLTNNGTVRVDAGTFEARSLSGTGQFIVDQAGVFRVVGGALNGNFTGSGTGAVHLSSVAVTSPSSITGVTTQIDGYVFGPEDLTIGMIDWRAGGFISNTGSAQPGITTILGGVIQGTATHYLERTARIAGAVDWKAGNFTQFQIPNSGLLQVASGGTLTVSGTADRDYSVPITVDSGGTLHATSTGQTGSSALLTNNGTVRVDAGTFEARSLSGTGQFIVDQAGVFRVVGGALNGNFTGSGTGAVHLSSVAVTSPSSITGVTTQIDGYVFGPEDLTIGMIDWRAGGFISNTGSAQPGITTILGGVIQGTATHYLERTARIAGAVDWKAGNFTQFQIPNSGLLQVASGGTLTVSGTADRDYSVPITVDSGGTLHATSTGQTGSSALLTNNGTVRVDAGTFEARSLTNSGIVIASGGRISIQSSVSASTYSRLIETDDVNGNPQFNNYTGLSLDTGTWNATSGAIEFSTRVIRNRTQMMLAGGMIGGHNSRSQLVANEGTLIIGPGNVANGNDQYFSAVNSQPAMDNSGTLRVLSGGGLGGSKIRSSGLVEGTGSIGAELTLEGGTITSTGTLTVGDLRTGAGISQWTAGILAGSVTIGTADEFPPASRLKSYAGATINGSLLFSHGELEINGTLNVQTLGVRSDSGTGLPANGTILGGTLNVANPIQFTDLGTVGIDSTATIQAIAGINVGSFGGTGIIHGNVNATAPVISFTSSGTLTLDGNLAFSGGLANVNGGSLMVTGNTSVAGDGVLTVNSGGALHTSNGLPINNATLGGNGDVFGAVTATSAHFHPTGTLRLRDTLALSGANTIAGATLQVDGTTTLNGSLTVTGNSALSLLPGTQLAGQLAINAALQLNNPLSVQSLTANGKLSGARLTVANHITTLNHLELEPEAQLNLQNGIDNGFFTGVGQLLGNLEGTGALHFDPGPIGTNITIVNGLARNGGAIYIADSILTVNSGVAVNLGTEINLSNTSGFARAQLNTPGLSLFNSSIHGYGDLTCTLEGQGARFHPSEVIGGVTMPRQININGDVILTGGDNYIGEGVLNVNGDVVVNGGTFTILPGAAVVGPGVLSLHGGYFELEGVLGKSLVVDGPSVIVGKTDQGVLLSGAQITMNGTNAELGPLKTAGTNSIEDGSLRVEDFIVGPGIVAIGTTASVLSDRDILVQLGGALQVKGTLAASANVAILSTLAVNLGASLTANSISFASGSSGALNGTTNSATVYVAGNVAVNGQLNSTATNVRPEQLSAAARFGGSGTAYGTTTAGQLAVMTGAGASGLAQGASGDSSGKTILAPGNLVGTLTVQKLNILNDVVFEIEIRDAAGTAGTGYDQLSVLESLTFDTTPGNLTRVDLVSLAANNASGLAASFDKTQSYAWTILHAGSITGFNPNGFAIDTSSFLNPFYGTFTVAQQANDLKVLYTPAAPLAGDYNLNGVVDAADYVVWRKTGAPPADYDTWRTNFGRTIQSGAGTSINSSSVPEPTSLAVAVMGLLFVAGNCVRLRNGSIIRSRS